MSLGVQYYNYNNTSPYDNLPSLPESKPVTQTLTAKELHSRISFENPRSLEEVIPILESWKSDPEKLIEFFSVADADGDKLLHFSELYNTIIPFLVTLEGKILVRIFSDIDDSNKTPLDYCNLFEAAIPFFSSLKSQNRLSDVIDILSISFYGKTPCLFKPLVFKAAIPFLETLDTETLVLIFSIPNVEGWILLNQYEVFTMAIPFLRELKSKRGWCDVLRILSIVNTADHACYACLFSRRVFNAAIPFLEELSDDELIDVFSIMDQDGHTCLTYERMWEVLMPYFKSKSLNIVFRIFSTTFADGSFALEYPKVFEAALPFLRQLHKDDLIDFLTFEVKKGRTFLMYPNMWEVMAPFLIEQSDDTLGMSFFPYLERPNPLASSKVFREAIPFLNSLKLKRWNLVLELLSYLNHKGVPCLFNLRVLKAAVPFLRGLETDKLLQVLSIKDENGFTLLMYPELWEVIISFLKTQTPERVVKIFSIKSGNGKTPLDSESLSKAMDPYLLSLDEETKDLIFMNTL